MSSDSKIVTRFAPSPTGMLHIGGARTALFNWLFARHHGGQFKLRIEDTDKARSTDAAIEAIISGLKWLELDWDGEIVYQSQRADRHIEVVKELLATGQAYHCYCSPEELQEMRDKARSEGLPIRYDGRWRDRSPNEAPEGISPVVRLKAEQNGETVIDDKVQGTVVVSNSTLDDLILLRSDGTPTYMLSVVVDDHDMEISHVIRGDDHLTNAARQAQIYKAQGWPLPSFAHIPMIHGDDGAKLSKRHGALAVGAYREMGYLASAMRNYLLRLGWSHGNDEIISTEQAVEWFSLEAINKGPARLDFDKLNSVNSHYLRNSDTKSLYEAVGPLLEEKFGDKFTEISKERVIRAIPDLKQRAKTIRELADKSEFLLQNRPLDMLEKAKKQLTPESAMILQKLLFELTELKDWMPESIDAALRVMAEKQGLKFGRIAQPLRAALTGGADSHGLAEVMIALGKQESLARIEDQTKAFERNS